VAHLFLSYNRGDQAVARRFAEAFESQGIQVWWDVGLRSGEAYDEVTENALRTAKAVVVLWSQRSVLSRWVRAEATWADRNKTLIPCMIEPCERPIMFELVQTADLSHWRGDLQDQAWLAFVADVQRFLHADGPAPAAAPMSRPAAVPEKVLAVLPLDNLSDDREMQFFADGVAEEIISRLARGSRLRIIGRTSSFQFRGAEKAKAPAALNASHVLDGSVRRAGAKVRIAAHLAEAASQETLWSERYDRSLEDIFAVQDEISEAIAAAMETAFAPVGQAPVDPAVYDLYLKSSPRAYAPEELRTCVGLLEVVAQRAPDFAEARARLAYLRSWLRFYQPYRERADSAAMVAADADRALAADPENPEALVAKYFVLPPFGRFVEADAMMERVRQSARAGEMRMYAGWHLRSLGRVRESVTEIERGFALDPMNSMVANMMALARMAVGRVAEAIPILQDLMARVPDSSFPVANLMRAYALLGDWTAVDRLLDPKANRPLRELADGLTFIAAKRDPAPANLDAMRSKLAGAVSRTTCIDLSDLVYAAHLGLVEEAWAAVEAGRFGPLGLGNDIMGPDAYRTGILFWAGMPELRSDPRFVRLCARLGLVHYWVTTGHWPDCAADTPYDFSAECERHRDHPIEAFPA
jgi:TolB-like protein